MPDSLAGILAAKNAETAARTIAYTSLEFQIGELPDYNYLDKLSIKYITDHDCLLFLNIDFSFQFKKYFY